MAKSKPSNTPADSASLELEYIGPPGQESPVFGLLVVGARYQATDPAFAEYLCTQHSEVWQRPCAATKE